MTGDLHIDGRYESACRTYSSDGVSPALPTAGGGGIVPKIEVAGSLGDGYIANNNVYSPGGIRIDYAQGWGLRSSGRGERR